MYNKVRFKAILCVYITCNIYWVIILSLKLKEKWFDNFFITIKKHHIRERIQDKKRTNQKKNR